MLKKIQEGVPFGIVFFFCIKEMETCLNICDCDIIKNSDFTKKEIQKGTLL